MKKFALKERAEGWAALFVMAFWYLVLPRLVEDHLFQALKLRMQARVMIHGEKVNL